MIQNLKLIMWRNKENAINIAQSKEKLVSKDLVEQMKEKIRKKQINIKNDNESLAKIVVLGSTKLEDSCKNIEYNERCGSLNHNILSFNQQKDSK